MHLPETQIGPTSLSPGVIPGLTCLLGYQPEEQEEEHCPGSLSVPFLVPLSEEFLPVPLTSQRPPRREGRDSFPSCNMNAGQYSDVEWISPHLDRYSEQLETTSRGMLLP